MQAADPAIIELLNEVLTNELTAINQYFVHSKMCANWGYTYLAEHHYQEALGEMKDAEHLIERILYLEGAPNLQRLGNVAVGENVPEQLRLDLEAEKDAIATLNRGVELCRTYSDAGSRELLEHILKGEEEHADWLETQLSLVDQIGETYYLAQQVRG